jgi:hypothetical protein
MTQAQTLKKLKRKHWQGLERMMREAYQEGFEAGLARAHGQGRRGRTIRADATVQGLLDRIQGHFGLDRYRFDLLVVHANSKKRVPSGDLLGRYRVED